MQISDLNEVNSERGRVNLLERVLKKLLLSRPAFWEKCGLQITFDHFYYPIPSSRDLTPELFDRVSEGVGIDWNLEEQQRHLEEVFGACLHELPSSFAVQMMASLDAAVYYAMIRHYKPRKIIEIGGGESTRVAALACLKNQPEDPCRLVCIEPYPGQDLRQGFDGLSRLIQEKVQSVPLSEFEDCDLLFIDSSHVVKMGSDVVWEMLEIVPRLQKGCLVHFHDIFLPREYPEALAKQRLFWSEQYLLWAFLLFNNSYKILWSSQFMCLKKAERLKEVFKEHFQSDYPVSSFWVQRLS